MPTARMIPIITATRAPLAIDLFTFTHLLVKYTPRVGKAPAMTTTVQKKLWCVGAAANVIQRRRKVPIKADASAKPKPFQKPPECGPSPTRSSPTFIARNLTN